MVMRIFYSCFEFLNILDFSRVATAFQDCCEPKKCRSSRLLMDNFKDHTSALTSEGILMCSQVLLEKPFQHQKSDVAEGNKLNLNESANTDNDEHTHEAIDCCPEKCLLPNKELNKNEGLTGSDVNNIADVLQHEFNMKLQLDDVVKSNNDSLLEKIQPKLKTATQDGVTPNNEVDFGTKIVDSVQNSTNESMKKRVWPALKTAIADGARPSSTVASVMNVELEPDFKERKKSLVRCASFPGSFKSSLFSSRSQKLELIQDGNRVTENALEQSSSSCSRSSSLPSSFKLISAMRGGQERGGLGPRPKLSVRWAPDVQEPRSSSVSHTVRSYHRWQSSKRKDYKHRNKGKAGHKHGSSKSDKKHYSRRGYGGEIASSRFWSRASSAMNSRSTFPGEASVSKGAVLNDNLHKMPSILTCIEDNILKNGSSDSGSPVSHFKCVSPWEYTIKNKHMTYAEIA